jgi:hypothetical protein
MAKKSNKTSTVKTGTVKAPDYQTVDLTKIVDLATNDIRAELTIAQKQIRILMAENNRMKDWLAVVIHKGASLFGSELRGGAEEVKEKDPAKVDRRRVKRGLSKEEKEEVKHELLKRIPSYTKSDLDLLQGVRLRMLAAAIGVPSFGKKPDEMKEAILAYQDALISAHKTKKEKEANAKAEKVMQDAKTDAEAAVAAAEAAKPKNGKKNGGKK